MPRNPDDALVGLHVLPGAAFEPQHEVVLRRIAEELVDLDPLHVRDATGTELGTRDFEGPQSPDRSIL